MYTQLGCSALVRGRRRRDGSNSLLASFVRIDLNHLLVEHQFSSTMASLIAQLVKNLPAMQKTLVRFLSLS